jgi:hypothetical protein
MALHPYQIFMKIYQAVQKLLVGDTQTDRRDLIPLLSFLDSRLKIVYDTRFSKILDIFRFELRVAGLY